VQRLGEKSILEIGIERPDRAQSRKEVSEGSRVNFPENWQKRLKEKKLLVMRGPHQGRKDQPRIRKGASSND